MLSTYIWSQYEHQWAQIGKDMVWEENKVKHFRNNNRQ